MARTFAYCQGGNRSSESQRVTRVGSEYVIAGAQTWSTFAQITVWYDGKVQINVKRGGRTIHEHEIAAEGQGQEG